MDAAPYALATGAFRPVQVFDTADALARAVLARAGARPWRVVRSCVFPPGPSIGREALSVYAMDERIAFVGYVLGFGHHAAALMAALDAAGADPMAAAA